MWPQWFPINSAGIDYLHEERRIETWEEENEDKDRPDSLVVGRRAGRLHPQPDERVDQRRNG